MSKYKPLWEYISAEAQENSILTFALVKDILGFEIDHSFLNYKKELKEYGYEVDRISMKEQVVLIKKI